MSHDLENRVGGNLIRQDRREGEREKMLQTSSVVLLTKERDSSFATEQEGVRRAAHIPFFVCVTNNESRDVWDNKQETEILLFFWNI